MADDQTSGKGGSQAGDSGDKSPKTFESFYGGLSAEDRALLDENTKGLKTALEAERENRKGLEKQLRDAAAKAEKGSELERSLTEQADKLKNEEARAAFYEEAHKAGVTNLRLAWKATTEDGLFKRNGDPDIEALKQAYPELFGKPNEKQNLNAGSGSGNGGTPNDNQAINAKIRSAAGRQ